MKQFSLIIYVPTLPFRQVDSLPLNQQSLINQRLYKKHLTEKVRQYQEETDRIIDEYSRYIEDCKEKFKLTNPTYKILQAKRTELKQNKIRCMDLERKIIELKDVNKQKMEIKQKLFYSDIVEFIQNWMNRRKHLETVELLREATMKEREYMLKLTEATEMLKRKQADRFLRNQTGSFNIPHIEVKKKRNLENEYITLMKLYLSLAVF